MTKIEIGQKFGKLTVTGLVKAGSGYRATCLCECGEQRSLSASRLQKRKDHGGTGSCGNRQCNRRYRSSDGSVKGWVSKGYRQIYVSKRKKYVPEHRLVIEESIGRILRRDEIVHHINGHKLDNRLENLEIMELPKHSREHIVVLHELSRLRKENKELRKRIEGQR